MLFPVDILLTGEFHWYSYWGVRISINYIGWIIFFFIHPSCNKYRFSSGMLRQLHLEIRRFRLCTVRNWEKKCGNTVQSQTQSFFVNNFRLRGCIALFLVSLDSCVHQDTHKKVWSGCYVWGGMYNCFSRDWCWWLVKRLSSVHEPSIYVNNFRFRDWGLMF